MRTKPEIICGWFLSFTGQKIYPLTPDCAIITIEDIAHSLANQCRFAGHSREFYSIAQHSVIVSRIVPVEFAMIGLMHDAAEAYLQDIIRPLKLSVMFELYRKHERLWAHAIGHVFGLEDWLANLPVCVEQADDVALMTEQRDLMHPINHPWSCKAEPLKDTIKPLTPGAAETAFLNRYVELTTRIIDERTM